MLWNSWEGYKVDKGHGQDPDTQQVGRQSFVRGQKYAVFTVKAFGIKYTSRSLPGVAKYKGENSTLIARLIYSNSIKENNLILISSHLITFIHPGSLVSSNLGT